MYRYFHKPTTDIGLLYGVRITFYLKLALHVTYNLRRLSRGCPPSSPFYREFFYGQQKSSRCCLVDKQSKCFLTFWQ